MIVAGEAARISRASSDSVTAAPVGFPTVCNMTSGVSGVSAAITGSTEVCPPSEARGTSCTSCRRATDSTRGG